MTRAQIEKAKSELEHALRALEDGSGHDEWGPGPVGIRLYNRKQLAAGVAFDTAAQAAFTLNYCSLDVGVARADRARFIAAMRKLAPVMLEVLLERNGDAAG